MRVLRHYYVYIMTNRPNGTLYVGVTGDLVRRVLQHRSDMHDGFTKRYQLHRLVYYEIFDSPSTAIWREKRIKTWLRAWKVRLILQANPAWEDITERLVDQLPFN
jgi:putative endonuclease